ncbi:MAG: hypothetical protein MR372_03120 [Lachnospiraceae bacterium]|nr:hypothetical protein [Lachnospiraceae bacterium]
MDKTEYQERLEELQELLRIKDYKAAYELVNGIDWRKVKSTRTLSMVADVYEVNKDYERCRQVLKIALSRSSIGKSILYRLTEICIKQRDIKAAEGYYDQYCKLAPRDNARLLLDYKLGRAVNRPIEEQIKILEEYKEREYTERWAYELAHLYSKAGETDKCVDACDDMILWFSEGKYVLKAMELKQKYKPLSPSQQMYYDKEQADSDAGLVYSKVEQGIYEDVKPAKGSVIDRMDAAGAAVTKDVNLDNTQAIPLSKEEMENIPVNSAQFMGGSPDLKKQLENSIKNVKAGVHDAPKVESKPIDAPEFDLEKFLQETQGDFRAAAGEAGANAAYADESWTASKTDKDDSLAAVSETDAEPASDTVSQSVEKPAEEAAEVSSSVSNESENIVNIPETAVGESEQADEEPADKPEEKAAAAEPVKTEMSEISSGASEEAHVKVKPAPVYDDREIPDPEPTEEEKRTRTIPLGKVGQNTVPISIEDILKSETPEERRIRILNNAMPTKMSDTQRQIFTYFARIPGMDNQILEAMTNVYEHVGEHTSKAGNIAIMGAVGTGKSRLSDGLIKAMCRDMQIDVAKYARITGDKMNMLDPAKVVSRMSGGFLIIENASDMSSKTIEQLDQAMEFRTDCMILIIEDEKTSMRAFLKRYEHFAEKFSGRISIPVFTNDELVTFARTYCAENNCQMDELGVLALYSLISNGQSEDQPMTISEVKNIVDAAMAKAKRGGRRGRKSSSKDKTVILYEKDFS